MKPPEIRDLTKPHDAQRKVKTLIKVNDADIPLQGEHRQHLPHEQNAQQRIQEIYPHAPKLLSQTLEAAVGHHIRVHYRDKRRKQPQVVARLGLGVYPHAELVGKNKQHKGNG